MKVLAKINNNLLKTLVRWVEERNLQGCLDSIFLNMN